MNTPEFKFDVVDVISPNQNAPENSPVNALDDASDTDTQSSENAPEKRAKRSIVTLDHSLVSTPSMFARICKKPDRDTMHAQRNSYKKRPLTIAYDMTLERIESRNDDTLKKCFVITVPNNDDKIASLPTIDADFTVVSPRFVNDKKCPKHMLSADAYPARLALCAFVLRILRPYHDLTKITCVTMPDHHDKRALRVTYKSSCSTIVYNACYYVFNDANVAYVAYAVIMKSLFSANVTLPSTLKMPDLPNLKSLKSLI